MIYILILELLKNHDFIISHTKSPCMQCVTGVFSEGFCCVIREYFFGTFSAMNNNIALVVIS